MAIGSVPKSRTRVNAAAKRYGCQDCGDTWSRKSEVPASCRPYTVTIRRSAEAFGGYESTCCPGEITW